MSIVERYVSRYIRRKRLVESMCAFEWMIDLLLIWLWCRGGHPIVAVGSVAALAICFFGLWLYLLFHSVPLVEASKEIERRVPAFDQRLVTAVSIAQSSPLADQLMEETQAIIVQSKNISLVSIQKLILPVIMGCGIVVGWYLSRRI